MERIAADGPCFRCSSISTPRDVWRGQHWHYLSRESIQETYDKFFDSNVFLHVFGGSLTHPMHNLQPRLNCENMMDAMFMIFRRAAESEALTEALLSLKSSKDGGVGSLF